MLIFCRTEDTHIHTPTHTHTRTHPRKIHIVGARELTAKRLPRKLVKDTVGKMKGNLAAIIKTEVATAFWSDALLALLMLQLHIDLECPVAGRPLVNENMKT